MRKIFTVAILFFVTTSSVMGYNRNTKVEDDLKKVISDFIADSKSGDSKVDLNGLNGKVSVSVFDRRSCLQKDVTVFVLCSRAEKFELEARTKRELYPKGYPYKVSFYKKQQDGGWLSLSAKDDKNECDFPVGIGNRLVPLDNSSCGDYNTLRVVCVEIEPFRKPALFEPIFGDYGVKPDITGVLLRLLMAKNEKLLPGRNDVDCERTWINVIVSGGDYADAAVVSTKKTSRCEDFLIFLDPIRRKGIVNSLMRRGVYTHDFDDDFLGFCCKIVSEDGQCDRTSILKGVENAHKRWLEKKKKATSLPKGFFGSGEDLDK